MNGRRELQPLGAADFEPHKGTSFRFPVGGEDDLTLELIEISSGRGDTVPDAVREPFSIVFRGPKDRVFEQQICPLEHPEMGVMEIFLVPLGPDEDGMRYEAVFS